MHNKKLEEAVNGPILDVLRAMVEFGSADTGTLDDESKAQVEAARMVAGTLSAVKVLLMQAGGLINDAELDDS